MMHGAVRGYKCGCVYKCEHTCDGMLFARCMMQHASASADSCVCVWGCVCVRACVYCNVRCMCASMGICRRVFKCICACIFICYCT